MQTRCRFCETIVLLPDEHICEKSDNPVFDKIETIHMVSKEGTGRTMGHKVVTTVGEDQTKTINEPQKLHCLTSAPNPQYTTMAYAVTCLKCLATIPKETVETEE
jgi:hypothetical protein